MKRQILVNGLLSLTAVSMITGCVDDKYDLSDIDTTSKFIVDNLTVPVRLQQIELKNVIDFDDDDPNALVKEDPETGKYVLSEKGGFDATSFNIGEVTVPAPNIARTQIQLNLSGLPIEPGSYIPLPVSYDIPLFSEASKPIMVDYKFEMKDVNNALKQLNDIKTKREIEIKVELAVLPQNLMGANSKLSFKNLKLRLPWGLDIKKSPDYTFTDKDENNNPDLILTVPELPVNQDGIAILTVKATGLTLGSKGKVQFPNGQENPGYLGIEGEVGVLEGDLHLELQGITMPNSIDINTNYKVSSFELASFSGEIKYNMEGINSEIDLNDLPDFLDNEDTNIIIANPQIIVDINNPVAKYGLEGKGKIILTSIFKNADPKTCESSEFELNEDESHLVFGPKDAPETNVEFDALGYVLTNLKPGEDPNDPDYKPAGLPEKIKVEIQDIKFDGTVYDFPLGEVGEAKGDYEFKAPLGFGSGTKIIYETTEGDWGDDMDDINITKVMVEADSFTNLPVSVKPYITPIDKNGNEIKVVESSEFYVPANASGDHVALTVEAQPGHTITDFDGVKFKAIVTQDKGDTNAIGPDLYIKLDNLKATVSGYYETSF